jgi:N utilization substance protein B
VAELLTFRETDARVVIDEAVSIARRFGTDDSGRFVNGMLDRIARRLRPAEFEEEG